MSIGPGTLTEMLHNCTEMIDGRVIKLSDIDLALIACNGGRKFTTMYTPDKALVRAQFMEVLVRLSFDKYFKTGLANDQADSTEMAFKHNYLAYFSTFECHNFRKDKYWKEEIDTLY